MTDSAFATIGPTAERIAHAGGLMEMPEITQRVQRRHHRVLSLVDGMHARGHLDEDCVMAYRRFERDWSLANSSPACVAAYGERIGGKGDGDETRDERKAAANARVTGALHAIASPMARRALVMAVSSRPADGISTVRPYSLDEIGRSCTSFASKMTSISAATALLHTVLHQLHRYYAEP